MISRHESEMAVKQLHKTTEEPQKSPLSLRERNKVKKYLAMLNATRELLLSEGYDKTTMEAIAELAEVGVATVYKYFGTKNGLVMEMARVEMAEVLEEVNMVVADPPADLADAVIAVLAPANDMQLTKAGASLVRLLLDEAWNPQGEVWRDFSRWVVTELKARIEDLLADFQLQGELRKSVDTKAAAHIIYSLADYNFICFARGEILSVEEMTELTNKQVRMLFGKWTT